MNDDYKTPFSKDGYRSGPRRPKKKKEGQFDLPGAKELQRNRKKGRRPKYYKI